MATSSGPAQPVPVIHGAQVSRWPFEPLAPSGRQGGYRGGIAFAAYEIPESERPRAQGF
jgi:hypothetical protein